MLMLYCTTCGPLRKQTRPEHHYFSDIYFAPIVSSSVSSGASSTYAGIGVELLLRCSGSYPQTLACTPKPEDCLPQTPERLPQPL